ncbi:MAG: hypothetical protein WA628_19735 [Terriglobales bacterium]
MRKQKIQRRMRNRVMENQAAASSPKMPAPVATSKRNDAAHE